MSSDFDFILPSVVFLPVKGKFVIRSPSVASRTAASRQHFSGVPVQGIKGLFLVQVDWTKRMARKVLVIKAGRTDGGFWRFMARMKTHLALKNHVAE